ncbi:spore coat associated protein CotJA [Mesobacillus subterraneus]|uniref:CotJA n=1 Tax=Mesobacillus subterraneus TaxID=285983 RepID=A0A0D6Z6A5_9BACI|nr:spore coat associated protein CotJA [Mesobacillus subterraneus]KIY21279.1 CotJA [Mesobacillus subterraneus]
MSSHRRVWYPYVSPFDPCPPIKAKAYSTPPSLFLGYQPPNLEQFTPMEALKIGTLWKVFYDPWYSPYEVSTEEDQS